jgi:hypothetical protein
MKINITGIRRAVFQKVYIDVSENRTVFVVGVSSHNVADVVFTAAKA